MTNLLGPIVSRATPASAPVKPHLQRRLDEARAAAAPRTVMGSVTYSANDTVTQAMVQRDREAAAKARTRLVKSNTATINSVSWTELLETRDKLRDMLIERIGVEEADGWLKKFYAIHHASPPILACIAEYNYSSVHAAMLAEIAAAQTVSPAPLTALDVAVIEAELWNTARYEGKIVEICKSIDNIVRAFGSKDGSLAALDQNGLHLYAAWLNEQLALRHAKGGIASGKQVALFGCRNDKAEAYVPLPDGQAIPVNINPENIRVTVVNQSNSSFIQDAVDKAVKAAGGKWGDSGYKSNRYRKG